MSFVSFVLALLELREALGGEEVEDVLDRADVLRVFIADLEGGVGGEFLFDGDREVDDVERIGAQVVDQVGFRLHFFRGDFELATRLPDAIKKVAMAGASRCVGEFRAALAANLIQARVG